VNSIAHIRESDRQIQSVEEHLLEVKKLAEIIGEKIGVKHIAGLAGMLHDMGKYTNQFREYILEAVNNPDSPPRKGSVDHSTAGGKFLFERFHQGSPDRSPWILAEIVGNVVISHHSYLHDYLNPNLESDYLRRVSEKEIEEFEQSIRLFFDRIISESEFQQYISLAIEELEAYLFKPSSLSQEGRLMFLSKFIFSALIDADRTNTRQFEENNYSETKVNEEELFLSYYYKLIKKIDSFQNSADKSSPINQLRREMSDQCDRFAENPPGVYTLSIPTGGGKTFASLRYALKHALRYGKKHIIYVVPYTTIIEQNAGEVRNILQDDVHVLEHHSNVVDDADDEDEMEDGRITMRQKLKLARDNWDSPIIFTTMVQFLNAFYSKGTRSIRRLHNLCESVIIFDEVQKVPSSCVSLFNQALNFLKSFGNSSLVLCTATQPALDFVEHKLELQKDAEMISQLDIVIEAFKRVEIIDRTADGPYTTDRLAGFVLDRLHENQNVLVILNTKSVVKRLYLLLKEAEISVPVYHLSTSMCPAHRNRILNQVRQHLEHREEVICISTQLIEAGVDISFDCVIRSLSGLDSIAQAAGRCNRHGKSKIRQVYIIDHAEENLTHLREIQIGKKAAMKILVDLRRESKHHGGNLLSKSAMDKYFQEFYDEMKSNLNYYIPNLGINMTQLLMSRRGQNLYLKAYQTEKRKNLPLFLVNSYRTAAEHFRVIDDQTTSVIVPYDDEGKQIIARLNSSESIADLSDLMRKAQRYTVNLFCYELDQLIQNGGLVSVLEGKIMVLRESAYHEEFGVDIGNDSGFDLHRYIQ
jgi:CRISPR-associated endonuclease/helicase Cas3